jgi:hypothetical protein
MMRQDGLSFAARALVRPKRETYSLALVLDAQEVHDIHFGENVVEAVADADAEFFKALGDEGRGSDEGYIRAEFEQAEDV